MPSEPSTAQTKQVSDISVKPNLLLYFSNTHFFSNYLHPFVLPPSHVLSCAHSSTDAQPPLQTNAEFLYVLLTLDTLNIFMGNFISSL